MRARSNETWDALVAGAGPGGTAAALTLARSGASVLLVERASLPRWKVCGACLGPAALAGLDALAGGEMAARAGAIPLDRMLLRSGRDVAALRLAGWQALSRTTLDHELVREAVRAGVTVWTNARARVGVVGANARKVHVMRADVEGETALDVEAGVVIDATGLGRGLTEDGRPATRPSPHAKIGIGAELDAPGYPVADGELHMTVGREGYVGLVRVEGGRLNVAAAVDASALCASTPEGVVAGILSEAGLPPLPRAVAHGWRGTPPLTRSVDTGASRLLRAGDAAGYVEPFTGEGIGWALADGRSAAEVALRALDGEATDALERWSRWRTATRSSGERLCRVLAWGLRRPRLVGLAVAALSGAPQLATPLVRRAARPPTRFAASRLRVGSV